MTTRQKRLRTTLSAFGVLLLAFALGCGASGEDEESSSEPETVLSRVEQLTPQTESSNFEPYERQLDANRMVAQAERSGVAIPSFIQARDLPPTLTDVLMHDFWMTANTDLELGVLGQAVTEAQMAQIIAFYVATPDTQIRGYRPQAHKGFIVGLTEPERTQLASEAAAYVQEHGFLGPPL